MIGDDAARGDNINGLVCFSRAELAALFADRLNKVLEQIDLVVVMLALKHGGDALQAHAGIDRGFWQRHAVARTTLLVLHKDEIPDLDKAVAVGISRARRSARDLVAMIIEDFRTRPARPRVAHGPEVVGSRDANNAVIAEPCDLFPESVRLVVVMIDRHDQALLVETEILGDQVPGELNRPILKVIAERKIAEHLEERVVARGVADVIEVVMLAPCPHAFLAGRRARDSPRFLAREDVLELHHTGVGEHQRRVVARHERRRGHNLVAVLLEVIQE